MHSFATLKKFVKNVSFIILYIYMKGNTNMYVLDRWMLTPERCTLSIEKWYMNTSTYAKDSPENWYDMLLPCAHVQGVKQSILSVVVRTKIARAEDLGI